MTVLEIGELTLPELARIANSGHEEVARSGVQVLRAWGGMAEEAIRAGEALLEAREKVPQGTWGKWLESNFGGSWDAACLYMRMARHKDEVRRLGITSQNQARDYLKLVGAGGPSGLSLPTWMKPAAAKMRAEGMTYIDIGKDLGCHPNTVRYWLNPEQEERKRARARRERARKLRAGAEALQQRANKRAVRKAGQATQEAWAMAERLQDVLAQAQRETTDRDARRALSEAGVHYRKMRDQIVKALGVD